MPNITILTVHWRNSIPIKEQRVEFLRRGAFQLSSPLAEILRRAQLGFVCDNYFLFKEVLWVNTEKKIFFIEPQNKRG